MIESDNDVANAFQQRGVCGAYEEFTIDQHVMHTSLVDNPYHDENTWMHSHKVRIKAVYLRAEAVFC